MKFNKKFLYAGMFSVMLLQSTPAISTVFAADNININDDQIIDDQINNDDQTNDNFEISNFSSKLELDEDLTGKHGNQIELFPISKERPWYKVWVENTSDHDYYIEVCMDNADGKVVGSFNVPKHTAKTGRILKANSFGDRYITIKSESGYPLSGRICVRVGSTEQDVH